MTAPTETGSIAYTAPDAWRRARSAWTICKRNTIAIRAQLTGATEGVAITRWAGLLGAVKFDLLAVRDTPGAQQYARDVLGDQAFNFVGEIDAVVAGIESTLTWLIANAALPNLEYTVTFTLAGVSRVPRSFSVGATSGLRSEIDTLLTLFN